MQVSGTSLWPSKVRSTAVQYVDSLSPATYQSSVRKALQTTQDPVEKSGPSRRLVRVFYLELNWEGDQLIGQPSLQLLCNSKAKPVNCEPHERPWMFSTYVKPILWTLNRAM